MSEHTGFEHDDASEEEFVDEFVEQAEDFDTVEEAPPAQDVEPTMATGHPAVDEVLRSLESLADRPVEEHVAVFEQAHDQLRRTLSGAGDED